MLAQFIRPRIFTADEVKKTLKDNKDGVSFPNNIVVRGLRDTMYIPTSPILNLDLMMQLLSSNFTVADCAQTSLYVASPLPHTRLSNLRNCTVALGPVSGVLAVDHCEHCTISVLCGSLVVSNCSNVRIFVCTNTPPVVLNGGPAGAAPNRNLLLAPYNSHYSTLEEHLLLTGINPKLNFWNVGLPSSAYVLPPDDFSPICFPVAPQGNAMIMTRANPCTVPQPYADALQNRMLRFQDISRDLQEAYTRLEEEGRADLANNLRTQVQSMFVEWLHKNGQANGLLELLHQPAVGK
ncbi:hypothetical protein STCU_00932 [Strigomonas culicis]|nr:hypothetical protein STCU_00932 [Strigomonas culicis]|eukprot:EPY35747.1 hypothetical protein STCU_00932 [Strigomonas culicis]